MMNLKFFFSLFKSQIPKKLDKDIEIDDSIKFYNLCFKYIPQFIEYLTLTSLVLLGSTLSILTAIHISTLTHSTLMKTLNPTINYINHQENTNTSLIQQDFKLQNETTDKLTLFDISSCSINILQPYSLSRPPLVQAFG